MSMINGKIAEQKLKMLALERAFPVYVPLIDIGVDLIIEVDYRLIRIQVKSTWCKPDEFGRYKIKTCSHNKIYDKDAFDFIAAYVSDIDSWYIIPIDTIESKSIRVNPKTNRGKFNKYKDRLDLIFN